MAVKNRPQHIDYRNYPTVEALLEALNDKTDDNTDDVDEPDVTNADSESDAEDPSGEKKPKAQEPVADKTIDHNKTKETKKTPWGDVYREVVYADLSKNKKYNNVFQNIVMFTNSRDVNDNKTLANVVDSMKELTGVKAKLYVFVAEEIYFEDNGDSIYIKDSKSEITIEKESNVDTLIITRLGVQGEFECEALISTLQDWGFFVLNPIQYAKRASNKYQTAVLLDKAKLPQPHFCLMTKADLDDEKKYKDNLKLVYSDWGKNPEEDEDRAFVCKILDGHGGTGVFMCKGKQLLAILQAIFAINPEQQLLLQDKKEAVDGDLRVHVLTLRNKQVIIAAMKRKKLNKSDFRSNVSLGAEAVPVKLTPLQEQIALKAAEVSKLPWCAVDIMPLQPGTDELTDVILELNASPGTEGISEVIDVNFISVLINELDNPNEFYIQDKICGYMEGIDITFSEGETISLLAKLDTGNGARSSSFAVENAEAHDGKCTFAIKDDKEKVHKYTLEIIDTQHVWVGNVKEERTIVRVPEIRVGKRKLKNVTFAVKPDRKKSTHVLLNRDVLSRLSYVVSSDQVHVLTPEKEVLKLK